MIRKTPNLLTFTKNIVNKKYNLGSCDCFNVILDYLDFRSAKYPEIFEGITKETYPELFKTDPVKAKQTMVRFIDSFLSTKNPGMRNAGDLLLIKAKKKNNVSLAIDGGNTNIICVSEELGVMVVSLSFYEILKCWEIS